MSNGWSAKEIVSVTTAVAGVVANSVVSKEFPLTAGGATVGLAVKVTVAAITVVGSVTAKLQTANGSNWEDVKQVSLTTTGPAYIRLMSTVGADAAIMPLLNKARIVITNTNAGDTVTLSAIEVLQAL